MLLAHHPGVLAAMRTPTEAEPWRVLVSGCLRGWPCGVEGTDYGLGERLPDLLALPTLHVVGFCPEDHGLGTPRTMPDIHEGDGFDVIAGRARVLDEHGADLTEGMLEGARAMRAFAEKERVELAILTDSSAACGTQVISLGCRYDEPRRFQKGLGVAAAMLAELGIPLVSQRDFKTLERIRARAEGREPADAELRDHHEHPWTLEHLPGPHPRR